MVRWRLWLWAYPELAMFPSWEEAQRAGLEVLKRAQRLSWWQSILALVWLAAPVAGCIYLAHTFEWNEAAGFLAVIAIIWSAMAEMKIGLLWSRRKELRVFQRSRLSSVGVMICSRCGLDLRGCRDLTCPQCGEDFEIRKSKRLY